MMQKVQGLIFAICCLWLSLAVLMWLFILFDRIYLVDQMFCLMGLIYLYCLVRLKKIMVMSFECRSSALL